ncbi:MAG: DNA translocase FtsK 4TM domain-containing protein [Pseudomonadota bacterium]
MSTAPLLSRDEHAAFARGVQRASGLVLICGFFAVSAALYSYAPSDPSPFHATAADPENLLGQIGATVSGSLVGYFGVAAWALALLPLIWGARLLAGEIGWAPKLRVVAAPLALISAAAVANTSGGLVGNTLFSAVSGLIPIADAATRFAIALLICLSVSLVLATFALGMRFRFSRQAAERRDRNHGRLVHALKAVRSRFAGVAVFTSHQDAHPAYPGVPQAPRDHETAPRINHTLDAATTRPTLGVEPALSWSDPAVRNAPILSAAAQTVPQSYDVGHARQEPRFAERDLRTGQNPILHGAIEPSPVETTHPYLLRRQKSAERVLPTMPLGPAPAAGPIADPTVAAAPAPGVNAAHLSAAVTTGHSPIPAHVGAWRFRQPSKRPAHRAEPPLAAPLANSAATRQAAQAVHPHPLNTATHTHAAPASGTLPQTTPPPLVLKSEQHAPAHPAAAQTPLVASVPQAHYQTQPAATPAAPTPNAVAHSASVHATNQPLSHVDRQPSNYTATGGHAPLHPAPAPVYSPPPLELLRPADDANKLRYTEEMLAEAADKLQAVLNDYGVRGEIIDVHPGPVVTLYELEPAPGTKASRVIGLAEDIARSMSAVSARVSTVPGRNVIGIELPTPDRETVWLRELFEDQSFALSDDELSLALGKDIAGEPVTANLARMPHLLIAGTTGSGKSVAINTMILSLLYRLSPQDVRLLMIDPKMLELSVYNDIPHLLAPVVTDPKKAVAALKWVVREMEERYQKMAKLQVRGLDSYNQKVAEALARGERFERVVQTGFDPETGAPVHETEVFDPEPMPLIVVIVDEMADLMMVAGKEIEWCIQRLAQMARASGIHLIMATQRPSVDVITGTIKANFPIRISFQVTSKIDSRTILGEQGAEQLLGRGDMLYSAGGSRLTRLHGPFVADDEVSAVVEHLRRLGPPDYRTTFEADGPEDDGGEGGAVDLFGETNSGEDALYERAVEIVASERRASTSFIQRRLQIGYNRAARIVDMMEDRGVVSAANHVGKREVLVGQPQ